MATHETPVRRPTRVAADPPPYAAWITAAEPRACDLDRQRAAAETERLVSVLLPVHRVPLDYLAAALDSLAAQTSRSWEACVACDLAADEPIARFLAARRQADPRIRIVPLETNAGISAATNAALAAAEGEFVALLDHDDTLAPEALWRMQEAIRTCPEADLLYSDKDCLDADGRTRRRPLFKPEWSPEMLFSVNYVTHFNLLRRSLVVTVGGFRPHVDGAQDWDIFFRVAERARRVVRVPGIHYHWRLHAASTSLGGVAAKPYVANAQQVSIQEHLDRLGLAAEAVPSLESGFQIRWRIPDETPVHLVLDGVAEAAAELGVVAHMAAAALAALPASTHVPPLRRLTVLVHPERQAAVVEALARQGCIPATVAIDVAASFPADISRDTRGAVRRHPAPGGAIVLLSGRVAVTRPGWLEALVGWVTGHPEIGFATGLVVGADENVVECGLVLDAEHRATPLFRGIPPWQWGWFGGPMWYRNVSAASPWALAVKADAWAEVDGPNGARASTDAIVALCRKVRRAGYRGLVEPHARIGLGPGPLPPVPPFHPSVGDDPCFHPAFSSVVPLRLAAGTTAAPARRPRALRHLPPALVLGGMHRSGTSLVASLLAGAGLAMGDRLLGAGRGNVQGHFEDLDFVEFHQLALRACGFHGDGILPAGQPVVPPGLESRVDALIAARRAGGRPWGWKDPRTLLFLDYWADRVPEAAWLFVFRSPWEVADSLYRRRDEQCVSDPLLAIRAWQHANRLLLGFARRHPDRCLVREFAQITADPAATFAAASDHLGIPLSPPPDRYEPGLVGGDAAARGEHAALIHALLPDVEQLYHELRDLAGSRVPLPARRGADGDAAAAAAVALWARGSRDRIQAAAEVERAVAAERSQAEQQLAEERVRAAAELAVVRDESARHLADAQAEITRLRAACDDGPQRIREIESLHAEVERLRVRLDEATRVPAPKLRTLAKLRGEAARMVRMARAAATGRG